MDKRACVSTKNTRHKSIHEHKCTNAYMNDYTSPLRMSAEIKRRRLSKRFDRNIHG